MLEATSNMAAGSKSLSDFDGLPWSSWAEYLESTKSPDDEEEKWKVPSGVMRLHSSDMEKFGLFPETDIFCTVVCNECGNVVKPQGLLNHMRVKHKDLLSIDKLNKLSVNDNSIKSVKYALNEKLMSKFVLNDKISSKTSEKLSNKPSSPNEKKPSDKYADKISTKSSDKISSKSSDKIKGEKLKLSSDKSFTDNKNDSSKSLSDVYAKTNELPVYKPSEKMAKLSNEKISKSAISDKYSSKFDERGRKSPSSSEKMSVKSVLSEKLLSKVAANEKLEARVLIKPLDKEVALEKVKTESVKAERPSMKSLLKEKILQSASSPTGGSLLRPNAVPNVASTTLSPPVLTPQNRTPERQPSTDMPVLSRKRRYRERKSTAPAHLDLDRHCGVWCDDFNKYCVRSLTCKVHSVSLRRAVTGRSKPFDTLLLEHRKAKESSRLSQEDQDESMESFSERVATPGDSTNSSGPSPNGSPSWSRSPSPSTSPSPKGAPVDDGGSAATALLTPCVHTSPPTPLASYQYPPFPPPLSSSPAPAPAPSLSQYLNTPLLNVALPGLGPNHSPRPPDSQSLRLAAREKGLITKKLNVKHAAFPPKPLRACLFQGRKSSGMFLMQRQLEAVRTGFSISMVRTNKTVSGNAPISCKSPPPTPMDSMSASLAPTPPVISTEPAHNAAALKSVVGTVCATKTVINEQKVTRPQKVTILPASAAQRANLPVRLPVTTASQQGVLRVPVNLKAVLPKPSPTNPIRYTFATRDNAQFHVPNILTASRVKGDERTQNVAARVKPDHVVSTLVPQLSTPVAVALANGPDATGDTNTTVTNDKLQQGLRVTVPPSVPQQITYLTAGPVAFQQIPVLSQQVLGQLQLQPKGASGALKLVAGSAPRTLLVQPEQDCSASES